MVSQCVELHCTSYNVEAGLRGTHTTRAEATLICEQLTAVIVPLLVDAEQAEHEAYSAPPPKELEDIVLSCSS